MSNDRINLPGGVDKIGHSSIQAWSAGDLFPAVLARLELGGGAAYAWDLVHYEVIAYGEVWRVAPIRGADGNFKFAALASDVGSAFFSLGYHDDLYSAAAQLALGLVMAKEAEKYEAELDKMEAALKAAVALLPPPGVPVDVAAAQAALEAGFAQMEKDLAAMGAIPAPAPYGWAVAGDIPVSKEEEEIPADYWMEKKALLCSDHPAEDPPAAESWLERRPARDCGVKA
jgi:hypothetical protein